MTRNHRKRLLASLALIFTTCWPGGERHDATVDVRLDHSEEDEIRFSLFKFKVRGDQRRPAWDFQYVIHDVEEGRPYGYRGRLVWKRFVSYDDCLDAYEQWSKTLR